MKIKVMKKMKRNLNKILKIIQKKEGNIKIPYKKNNF